MLNLSSPLRGTGFAELPFHNIVDQQGGNGKIAHLFGCLNCLDITQCSFKCLTGCGFYKHNVICPLYILSLQTFLHYRECLNNCLHFFVVLQ